MGELSVNDSEQTEGGNISRHLASLSHSPFVTAMPRHFPRKRGQLLVSGNRQTPPSHGELANQRFD